LSTTLTVRKVKPVHFAVRVVGVGVKTLQFRIKNCTVVEPWQQYDVSQQKLRIAATRSSSPTVTPPRPNYRTHTQCLLTTHCVRASSYSLRLTSSAAKMKRTYSRPNRTYLSSLIHFLLLDTYHKHSYL